MKNKIIMTFISTMGWCGYAPAPGTFASLFCMLVYGFLYTQGVSIFLLSALTIILMFVGFYAVHNCLPCFSHKDPSCIVIDEVVGMACALLCVPFSWSRYIAVFVLFRFFDISKSGYLRYVEKLPGAYGVMLDDIGAALYAVVSFWVIYLLCF